jgi:hypothetical protein
MTKKPHLLYEETGKDRVTVSLSAVVIRMLDDMAMHDDRSRSSMLDYIMKDYFFPDELDESDPSLDELSPGEFVRVGRRIVGAASCG